MIKKKTINKFSSDLGIKLCLGRFDHKRSALNTSVNNPARHTHDTVHLLKSTCRRWSGVRSTT